MKHGEFVGQAVKRLELPSRSRGIRVIRAVLSTLGERLPEGEAQDLAGSLPMEIDYYVTHVEHGQKFDYDEFIDRVMERENEDDRADAVFHAKAVVALVREAVPDGEYEDLQGLLPDDFDDLFEIADQK